MSWPLTFLALGLAACAERVLPPAAGERVTVVDRADRPIPRAVVWSLPGQAWQRRRWIPGELLSYYGNAHELLLRLGTRQVADAAGIVHVPYGSVVAGEAGALAGCDVQPGAAGAARVLVLDDWRWTIDVRDADGKPVPGVPVACRGDVEKSPGPFQGLPIGLTDAQGRLVVRAPGGVDVTAFLVRAAEGTDLSPPQFVSFEVDGLELAEHRQNLRFSPGDSGQVTLTLPPVTRIEVRVPDWNGPIADVVTFRSLGWDEVNCWNERGKHYGLVGVAADGYPKPICPTICDRMISPSAEVSVPAGQDSLVIPLDLGGHDMIVRAQVCGAEGQPASFAILEVRPACDQVRTRVLHADRDGAVALILRPGYSATRIELEVAVEAAPDPELVGSFAKWSIGDLYPFEHRDVGVITLGPRR